MILFLTNKIRLNINKDHEFQVLQLNKRCSFDMRQYLFGIVYLLFHFQATKVQYCIASTLKFTNNCTFYL